MNTIRPATVADIHFIRKIAADTWPVAYGSILSREQLDYMLEKMYSIQSLEAQMKEGHHFYIAMLNDEPGGFAAFSRIEGDIFKLQKLYVLPTIQKTGLGLELLKTVEAAARNMGCTRLQLNVNRNNNAKSFYEKNSFTVIREEDIDIGRGYFMNDFIMEKLLFK